MKVLLLRPPAARPSYIVEFLKLEPLAAIYLAPVLREHELHHVDMRVQPDLARALDGLVPDAAVVAVHTSSIGALDGTLATLRRLAPRVRVLLHADAEYGNVHVPQRPMDFAHPLADALTTVTFLAPLRDVVAATIAAWEQGPDLTRVPGLLLNPARAAHAARDGVPAGGGAHAHAHAHAGAGPRGGGGVGAGGRAHGDAASQTAPPAWIATSARADVIGAVGVPDRTILGPARGRYRFFGIDDVAFVMHSFGCRYACRFCTMSKTDDAFWTRPVRETVDELAGLSERRVMLVDFEPLHDPDGLRALADAIETAGIRKQYFLITRADAALRHLDLLARWRAIGLRWVFLGLDGHDDARLRAIHKGTTDEVNTRAVAAVRALGLVVGIGLTVPTDASLEDFAALARRTRELSPPALVGFTIETPLVGTRLYDDVEASLTTRDWSLYDLMHAVTPTRLPLARFYRQVLRLHLLAGRRGAWTLLRGYPVRSGLRMLGPGGARAMWRVLRAAADHARPRPPAVARPSHAV